MEATQAIILENQSVILNLLCEVASANGISTDDVPNGEKRQKTKQHEDGKRKRGGTEKNKEEKQVRKKVSEEASKKYTSQMLRMLGKMTMMMMTINP